MVTISDVMGKRQDVMDNFRYMMINTTNVNNNAKRLPHLMLTTKKKTSQGPVFSQKTSLLCVQSTRAIQQ